MKTLRLFCLATLITALLTAPAFAGPLGKTIKGGISYATIEHDFLDFDHDLGFVLGLAMNYGLTPGLALQPEILYVQMGAADVATATDEMGQVIGTLDVTTNLDYIQIPVLLKVDVPLSGSILPTLLLGPAVAFNINADNHLEGMGIDESGDLEDISSTDVSLILGLGMKLGAGPAGVNLELRYNHGLKNIYDDALVDIHNRSIQAMVGYSF